MFLFIVTIKWFGTGFVFRDSVPSLIALQILSFLWFYDSWLQQGFVPALCVWVLFSRVRAWTHLREINDKSSHSLWCSEPFCKSNLSKPFLRNGKIRFFLLTLFGSAVWRPWSLLFWCAASRIFSLEWFRCDWAQSRAEMVTRNGWVCRMELSQIAWFYPFLIWIQDPAQ